MRYSKAAHTRFYHRYHVVWVTKYRFKVLRGAMRERLREIIRQTCAELGVHIVRGVLARDHVHMFLSIPPKLSLAYVMQRIKGRSSRRIQMEFPELRKRYWGQRFWARGYFSNHVRQCHRRYHPELSGITFQNRCYRRKPVVVHFYWIHRWLHWPPLYKLAHALHHRNTNVGPWSGLSMHPVEHLLFFSSVLIHWIIAAHPIHILFHMQHQALTAATSHTGFEGLLVKDKNRLALGTFHHQMHHRYFECNYGNLEVPWDRWFGSFHDGTEEAHERMKVRRRKLQQV